MKPIIIYIEKGKSLTFTKEEFEAYLEQAYNQGYADGCSSRLVAGAPVVTRYVPNTGDNPLAPPYIWTCNDDIDVKLQGGSKVVCDDSKTFYNDCTTAATASVDVANQKGVKIC